MRQENIDRIKRVFVNFPEIHKAVLYGSRAMGNYQKNSDIDISLIGDGLSLNTLFKIEVEFDNLLLPYNFDVSIFDKIENSDLIEHIKSVGKVFYERK